MFFESSAPTIGQVPMETFSKPSFTHFFQKMAPRGGGVYQISPDVALTTCIHLYSESTRKANLWKLYGMFFEFSAPKIGGVLMKTFSKPSFTHFFEKKWPPGGGLPDFTRCGTNYLHTPLLKTYPKSKCLDSNGILFWIRHPQNRGGPHENIFKTLIYPFPPKNGPRGGGAGYQISPDVALTTCIHLYFNSTQRANLCTTSA